MATCSISPISMNLRSSLFEQHNPGLVLSCTRVLCGRTYISLRQYQCKKSSWAINRIKWSCSFDERLNGVQGSGFGKSAAEETLEMLEWPRLRSAVANFGSTEIGKARLRSLTLPDSIQESEKLIAETRAAIEFDALYGGVLDLGSLQTEMVKSGLERAEKGIVLTAKEAFAVSAVLEVSLSLRRSLRSCSQENKEKQGILQPITDMVVLIGTAYDDIIRLIRSVVDEDGVVKDNASSELKRARAEAQSIERKLQELLKNIIREKVGSEAAGQVANINGRLCMSMAVDNAQDVPGLFLQSSESGLMAYIEPLSAVPLNNLLAEAQTAVTQAEYSVLSTLTNKVFPFLDDINMALEFLVSFDVIMGRAKYSLSMGGTMPIFIQTAERPNRLPNSSEENSITTKENTGEAKSKEYLVHLRGLKHPLLLQQHREYVKTAKEKLKSQEKILRQLKSRPGVTTDILDKAALGVLEAERNLVIAKGIVPMPVDVCIRRKIKVVTITGPNTGGKTATMKTIGLAALMAKAGLYILADEPACVSWFDSIFADIGDEQSLSQSLSTFSGHLHRVKRIKYESTGNSLILLDEVGAGTDSYEGAALGMALLESFLETGDGGSCLTIATTHHQELKTLKYSDGRFENASVEFDDEKLKPTFKLLWGIPGRSNALSIAEKLGLLKEIIREAQKLHGSRSAELNEVIEELEEARQVFDRCIADGEQLLRETKQRCIALSKATSELQRQASALKLNTVNQLAAEEAMARSTLGKLTREAKRA